MASPITTECCEAEESRRVTFQGRGRLGNTHLVLDLVVNPLSNYLIASFRFLIVIFHQGATKNIYL